MDNTRPSCTAKTRKLLEMIKQAVDEGAGSYPRPGMNYETCRFFDDYQILVLVIDLERNLLRCKRNRFERFQIHVDAFGSANAVTGFFLTTIDVDCSGPVQLLNLRPSDVFEIPGQEMVQTRASVVRPGRECHCE